MAVIGKISVRALISNNSIYLFIKYYYHRRNWSPSSREGTKVSGQSIRAYHAWHHNEMTLDTMCKELTVRKKEGGLKPATVMYDLFFFFLPFFPPPTNGVFIQFICYRRFESRSVSSLFSAKVDQACSNGYGVMDLS